MLLVKIASSQGSLGKNEGSELAPKAIIEKLRKQKAKFKLDEARIAQSNFEATNNFIYNRAQSLITQKNRPIFLGGDHSITFPLFKAFRQNWQGMKVGLISFDAHPDCVQNFKPPSHEDWLRVLVEDKFLKAEHTLLLGAQDYFKTESQFLKKNKIKNFDLESLRENFSKAEKALESFLKNLDVVYLSFDIDVLHLDLAPGTGYRLKDGLTLEEAARLVKIIKKSRKVKAMDLVEVNPEKDKKEVTVESACKIIRQIM